MSTFTEVLEEYLLERERQNGDYYDNMYFGARVQGRYRMQDLAKELNEMVQGVKNE